MQLIAISITADFVAFLLIVAGVVVRGDDSCQSTVIAVLLLNVGFIKVRSSY